MKAVLLTLTMVSLSKADIYLQAMRGSNNRLDEENRDRNNANRLFDSQNNNRGGYNVGNSRYFKNSELAIEWTAQHGCGGENNHCELIVQYMCSDYLRDGTSTNTIPDNPGNCEGYDCDLDLEYGMHENFASYKHCKNRERNKGVFTSDQKLKGETAIYTRQNPNGARSGYECAEERDYYPYWQPSPWKDLVILTNDVSRCDFYQKESQNVKGRWYCDIPAYEFELEKKKNPKLSTIPASGPNAENECKAISFEVNDELVTGQWVQSAPNGAPAPKCSYNEWSRDNHLGNVATGFAAHFNITVPEEIHTQCAMRIRYNISTGDIAHEIEEAKELTAEQNEKVDNNNKKNDGANVDIFADFGLDKDSDDDKDKGYELENNPQVDAFGLGDKAKLQLAVNTAQYGRTFQDRSHRFQIADREEGECKDENIFNLEVKGKRGNIVQVFPGTEYAYHPNRLNLRTNKDCVHMHWTGSDTNPKNNDGQGRAGTDRSNIVQLTEPNYDEPLIADSNAVKTFGHWGNSFPHVMAKKNQCGAGGDTSCRFMGVGYQLEQQLALATGHDGTASGDLSELDDASPHFDAAPFKCNKQGVHHYMGTRNNNFSNRSQKGKIVCSSATVMSAPCAMGTACELKGSGFAVKYNDGSLKQSGVLTVEVLSPLEGLDSQVVHLATNDGVAILELAYDAAPLMLPVVYQSTTYDEKSQWEQVPATCSDGKCVAENVDGTGYFVVQMELDAGMVSLIVLICIAVLGIAGFLLYRRHAAKK